MLEQISQFANLAFHRIHVRSALNPILWLCVLGSPICIWAAWIFKDDLFIRNLFVIFAVAPFGIACVAYIGFAVFHPDKLQSEDYQIRHESLQIVQQKSGRITLDPTSLDAIVNPELHMLERKPEGER
ncbi:MAG: hypothetical protein BVN29_16415 [Nitrospira sp. ST-bin5]|nr:MAG: hypothetical protein BVN29_16415 [Nitrospira sp. ST-bin5]